MKKWWLPITIVGIVFLGGMSVSWAGYADHFTETQDIGQFKAPNRGVSNILVIRVQVNINPVDWGPWVTFFDNDATGMTFRNYYRTMSLGAYDPIITLTDPIIYETCPTQFSNPTYFPNCSIARGDPMALIPGMKLFREIFQRLADEQPAINLQDFDVNGLDGGPDGWLDGVVMMSNLDFTGIALPTSMLYNVDITPELCDKLIIGLEPYLAGIPIDPDEICDALVNMTPEEFEADPLLSLLYKLESQGQKVSMIGISSTLDPEVVPIHEFGHVLGYGDLYREHYYGVDPPETYTIPGLKYSLMGSHGTGFSQLDGFSRMRIGWAKPIEVNGTMRVVIPPVKDTGVVYYFRSGNEMFIVENRGPDDQFDGQFTRNGLAVYHVDLYREPDPSPFGVIFMLLNCLNCNDWHPFVMNEQADGLFELQMGVTGTIPDNDLFHTGGQFLPGPVSEAPISRTNLVFDSNTYDGYYSGFSITDIDSDSQAPNIVATLSDGSWTVTLPSTTTQTNETGGCSLRTGSGQLSADAMLFLVPLIVGIIIRRRRVLRGM